MSQDSTGFHSLQSLNKKNNTTKRSTNRNNPLLTILLFVFKKGCFFCCFIPHWFQYVSSSLSWFLSLPKNHVQVWFSSCILIKIKTASAICLACLSVIPTVNDKRKKGTVTVRHGILCLCVHVVVCVCMLLCVCMCVCVCVCVCVVYVCVRESQRDREGGGCNINMCNSSAPLTR